MAAVQNLLKYKRYDNVEGVGYAIRQNGDKVYAIAWADGQVNRYDPDYVARAGIAVEGEPAEPSAEPAEPSAEAGDLPSEETLIRDYLEANPDATNAQVIAALKAEGVTVQSGQVSAVRKKRD